MARRSCKRPSGSRCRETASLLADKIEKRACQSGVYAWTEAAARQLAEAGCTANEIASFTGHATLQQVSRYTKATEQRKLAQAANAAPVGSESEAKFPNQLERFGNPREKTRCFKGSGGGLVEPRGIEPMASAVRLHTRLRGRGAG